MNCAEFIVDLNGKLNKICQMLYTLAALIS